ncbi:outer membrane protein [Phreatobacter sp.]|uniref:outer membrane protein n=1 Tax=Phreatobacter sp. TaxID=1966341 RepID=UPI003F6F89BB
MKKMLLAGVAGIALATSAQAADLAAPRMPIAESVIVPAFSWTGFYVGGQIGYATSASSVRQFVTANGAFIDASGYNVNGIVGGVHIGYNQQFNNIVLGLEADLEGGGLNGRFTYLNGDSWRSSISLQGSLRARAGVAVDRALFYVTGGVALANLRDSGHLAAGPFVSESGAMGWTVGAGLEYAFTPNWTARAEYRYTNYGTRSVDLAPIGLASTGAFRNRFHSVRLGVSYLFSTGGGAVVARY